LGSAAAIIAAPTPVSAVTCTATRVRRVPAAVFRHLLEHDDDVSFAIHRAHSVGLCRQIGWIGELGALGARRRLELVIQRFIDALRPPRSPAGITLHLPVRLWELAGLIAVSPEHLSRLLREMEQEGVLRRAKQAIIVPDIKRLA
jgi:CRP-like cAMP-binding protein